MTNQSRQNNSKKRPETKKPNPKPKNPWQLVRQVFGIILILILVSTLYSQFESTKNQSQEVAISEVVTQIQSQNVEKITVSGGDLEVITKEGNTLSAKKEREASLTETLTNYGITPSVLESVEIEIKNESGFAYWFMRLLPIFIPLLFVVFFLWFLSKQMKGSGGGMRAFTFGQSKAKVTDPSKQKITFGDVAGNIEAKSELQEIVDFLKHPKKFLDIGATIPKGVLLMGSPGTGKTLLARAVAGEAKVPFFHLSGSEFVEMFVGVGASRVRDLFANAKKMSPAIIFIDEIDAVGRSRGVGIGGGNDEREQTLNQILVEMDGFEANEKIIIVAATNRPDVLDPALLRPGRFDRRVHIDVPDRKDREAILNIHARKKPLDKNVDLKVIAKRTPGFSGADLQSIMNEAAILTARNDRKKITQTDLIESIEKVMIGPERKSHIHTKREREIVAYHEAGHAIVASALENADPVQKVSIVARGHAGGYTLKLPNEERKLDGKKHLMDDLAMSLGGYVAEQMIFNDVTTGPSNDIQVATKTARNMVSKWGMSDSLGPVAYQPGSSKAHFGQATKEGAFSQKYAERIDDEVQVIMHMALQTAQKLLSQYQDALDVVAKKLLEVETLEQDDYNKLVKPYGLPVASHKTSPAK